jgi:hypothetical protein
VIVYVEEANFVSQIAIRRVKCVKAGITIQCTHWCSVMFAE